MKRYKSLFEQEEYTAHNECPFCHYPLEGMDISEGDICPNCGQEIHFDTVNEDEFETFSDVE